MKRFTRRRNVRRRIFRRPRIYKRTARIVRRTLTRMAETKFNLVNISSNNLITGLAVNYPFNGIAQGTGPTNRIGNSVRTKRLSFRYSVYFNFGTAIGASTYGQIRVCLIYPRRSLNTQAGGDIIAPNFNQFWNAENYIVLYDKTHDLSANAQNSGTGTVPVLKHFRFSMPTRYVIRWRDPNVNNAEKQPILVYFTSLPDVLNGSSISLNGQMRVSFIDV